MARLAAEPQRFTFDAVVRLLTFHRRRADPAGAARFTSVAGSSYPGAEVTEVQAAAGYVCASCDGRPHRSDGAGRRAAAALFRCGRGRSAGTVVLAHGFPGSDFASHDRGLRRCRRKIPPSSRRRCRRADTHPAAYRSGGRGPAGLDRLRDPGPCRTPACRCGAVAPLRRLFLGPSALGRSPGSVGFRLAGATGESRAICRRLDGFAARPADAPACRRVSWCVWPAGPRCRCRCARLGPAGADRAPDRTARPCLFRTAAAGQTAVARTGRRWCGPLSGSKWALPSIPCWPATLSRRSACPIQASRARRGRGLSWAGTPGCRHPRSPPDERTQATRFSRLKLLKDVHEPVVDQRLCRRHRLYRRFLHPAVAGPHGACLPERQRRCRSAGAGRRRLLSRTGLRLRHRRAL